MESIIITITDMAQRSFLDIEVPIHVTMDRLKEFVAEIIDKYAPGLHFEPARTDFVCNRTGNKLWSHETLESAGVWNGDYITLMGV